MMHMFSALPCSYGILYLALSMSLVYSIAASASPPGTLVIVTAGQGGLMSDTGPLNPHAYRPNEFVVQNMIYDGLVYYGENGNIEPALAESWEIAAPIGSTGETAITFRLRRDVTFHDGERWDAHACKANFDNLFPPQLKQAYHSWFNLPTRIKTWQVVDDYTFRLILDQPYYPALQEFSLIRPIRFISPKQLPTQPNEKSCPVTAPSFWSINVTDFTCVGTSGVAGTGPWVFEKKVTTQRTIGPTQVSRIERLAAEEKLLEVHFVRNMKYWNRKAGGNVQKVVIKILSSLDDVGKGLAAGTVDMVFGVDTIDPKGFKALHLVATDNLQTYISGPLSTRKVTLNSARPPLNSLAVRKAIVHAINKEEIIARELAGLEQPAYTLFSETVPYADVQLVPKMVYDPEKVRMLLDNAGWTLAPGETIRSKDGVKLEVEFVFRTTRAIEAGIEDDIRRSLQALGIGVISTGVVHDEWNRLVAEGQFHLAFGTTNGLPWDPHSSTSDWRTWKPDRLAFSNLSSNPITEGFQLAAPMNQTQFYDLIGKVLVTPDEQQRRSLWQTILTVVHEQAINAPISYLVNVAVVRDRFENFKFGSQQYDMLLHQLVDRALLANSVSTAGSSSSSSQTLSKGAIAAIAVCASVALLAVVFISVLVVRERRGRPLFSQPLLDKGQAGGGYSAEVECGTVAMKGTAI